MKLRTLQLYQELKAQALIEFKNQSPRKVRMEFLITQPTVITILTKETHLPILLNDSQTLEFNVSTEMAIEADKALHYYTSEGMRVSKQAPTGEKFTKVTPLPTRNKDHEAIAHAAASNAMKLMAGEMDKQNAKNMAELNAVKKELANASKPKPKSDTSDASTQQTQTADPQAPTGATGTTEEVSTNVDDPKA